MDRLRELAAAGVGRYEIAAQLGRTYQSVWFAAKRAGIEPALATTRWTPERIGQLRAIMESPDRPDVEDVAEQVGVNRPSLYKACEKYGVTIARRARTDAAQASAEKQAAGELRRAEKEAALAWARAAKEEARRHKIQANDEASRAVRRMREEAAAFRKAERAAAKQAKADALAQARAEARDAKEAVRAAKRQAREEMRLAKVARAAARWARLAARVKAAEASEELRGLRAEAKEAKLRKRVTFVAPRPTAPAQRPHAAPFKPMPIVAPPAPKLFSRRNPANSKDVAKDMRAAIEASLAAGRVTKLQAGFAAGAYQTSYEK
jgi:flagellar biosynthesis GTPase FlhF